MQIGTHQPDLLIGTNQEDYLIGGADTDTFIPNSGCDGINGGPEIDRVILAGNPSEFSLRQQGEGYELLPQKLRSIF